MALSGYVGGYVIDEDNDPVPNPVVTLKVTINGENLEFQTAIIPDGSYYIGSCVASNGYVATADAYGYQEKDLIPIGTVGEMSWSKIDIVLVKYVIPTNLVGTSWSAAKSSLNSDGYGWGSYYGTTGYGSSTKYYQGYSLEGCNFTLRANAVYAGEGWYAPNNIDFVYNYLYNPNAGGGGP